MYDWGTLIGRFGIWIIFFASSVYGHIGFKFAAQSGAKDISGMLFSLWGISAALAWAASAVLWVAILSKNSLIAANTTSALSHAMIAVVALLLFREVITTKQAIGIVLVIAGVYLVNQ
jgi:uncharacterized membrane protein